MSWAPTKITCKCGAVIESRWTSELKDWQDRHDVCLKMKMTKDDALKLALAALKEDRAWLESDAPKGVWDRNNEAITASEEILAQSEQEETTVPLDDPSFLLFQMKRNYPPECTTEAEKNAFAFGWWKAMEELKKKWL